MPEKKGLTKSEFINKYLGDQLDHKAIKQEKEQKEKFAKDYKKRKKKEKEKRKDGQKVLVERNAIGKVMFTDRHIQDIIERHNACETMSSIGKRYGVSRQTIRETLKKEGEL